MSEGGGIVIPAAMRDELGLKPGDHATLEMDDGQLRVMPRVQAIRRAQEALRKYVAGGPSAADELIAERRAESARD